MNFKATKNNVLQFMLEKCKNGFLLPERHHVSEVWMAIFQSQ